MASPAPRSAAAFPAVGESARTPSFDVLDDVVRLAETRGLMAVRVARAADVAAVSGHVGRRGAQNGRHVVRGANARVESAWRDVAARLGVEPIAHDPVEAARAIVARAEARSSLVVVPTLHHSVWDQAVCEIVAAEAGPGLFVVVVPASIELNLPSANWFEVESELDGAGLDRWWDGIAAEARRQHEGEDLAALEAWRVAALSAVPSQDARVDALPGAAHELLLHLRVAGRAWPRLCVGALGDPSALGRLSDDALVEVRDGLVVPCAQEAGVADDSIAAETLIRIAAALVDTFPGDAWGAARAAELFSAAGDARRAEEQMQHALELAVDASSRSELWQRWAGAVELLPHDERGETRIRGAELALDLGDVEVALEWAEGVGGQTPSYEAAFVLGRAQLARGDLVSARAALRRALDLALDDAAGLAVKVALGEAHFSAGGQAEAQALADEVCERADDLRVRLGARNLAGKLLLARGRWAEADEHFAADVCDASIAGLVADELRARVNRAIALLSRGSYDEARPMLLEVLADAEERGELRGVGFALSNLAVIAIERHDYRTALELCERTLTVRRRLGERLGYARDVTNLVELRLRLGLIGPAEEALRFGRQSLGPGAPASRLAELALVAARVHFARGRTLEAEREVRAALRTASQATDGEKLSECHRFAARIALEDGALERAESDLQAGAAAANNPIARAEVAVLELSVARASGQANLDLAREAVRLARESGDEELAREAHTLAAEVSADLGDDAGFAAHVESACQLRDEVARSIGPQLGEAFLGRRDLSRLAALENAPSVEGRGEAPALARRRSNRPVSAYIGRHPLVRALIQQVGKVGGTDATVLVHGESGTGKELVAEAIHAASRRVDGPLVKVNCAALVETLLLSELFGHEKGAFTGANARKRGRFERANGGTLFLDEIGDISPRTQVALLRVLEERTIERVGGGTPISVDVRIVCATNRDLRSMVERGEFREDLYYRLAGITLDVPPLRDRLGDLPLLCDGLLDRIAVERKETAKAVAPDALELLARHRWPGNVRELENTLRAVSLFCEGDVIRVGDLVEHVDVLRKLAEQPASVASLLGVGPASNPSPRPLDTIPPPPNAEPVAGVAYREIRQGNVSLGDLKRQIERDCIEQALDETGGNITRAAQVLGMKRPRLSQLVKQYELLVSREAES